MNGTRRRRSHLAAAAAVGSLALVLTACSGGDDEGGGGDATSDVDCTAFEQYGDLEGKTISVYTSIVDPESVQQTDSYKPFEECTGATIEYEGSREFEAQLPVRLQAGNPPDIAYIPQPGFLASIVADYPDVVVRGPAGGHRQRQRVLHRGLGQLRHGRRHALRDAARRQREVVRLVLAGRVRGERLRDPHDVGRPHGPHRPDRRRPPRRQAVVRGHRVR